MSFWRPAIAASVIFALGGCATSVSVPVTVAPQNGDETLRGIVTATIGSGQAQARFGVANSKIQCSGEYPFTPGQGTVNIATTCSDGRTGSGTAVRTSVAGGRGTIRMSDGTEAVFAYGPEALAMRAASHPPAPSPPPPLAGKAALRSGAPTGMPPGLEWIPGQGDWSPEQKAYRGSLCVAERRQTPGWDGPKCSDLTAGEKLDIMGAQSKLDAAERLKRQAAAKPFADKAVDEWGRCIRGAATALALRSAEPA